MSVNSWSAVFNKKQVRSAYEPGEGQNGTVIVRTHCSFPATMEDFRVEWFAVTVISPFYFSIESKELWF